MASKLPTNWQKALDDINQGLRNARSAGSTEDELEYERQLREWKKKSAKAQKQNELARLAFLRNRNRNVLDPTQDLRRIDPTPGNPMEGAPQVQLGPSYDVPLPPPKIDIGQSSAVQGREKWWNERLGVSDAVDPYGSPGQRDRDKSPVQQIIIPDKPEPSSISQNENINPAYEADGYFQANGFYPSGSPDFDNAVSGGTYKPGELSTNQIQFLSLAASGAWDKIPEVAQQALIQSVGFGNWVSKASERLLFTAYIMNPMGSPDHGLVADMNLYKWFMTSSNDGIPLVTAVVPEGQPFDFQTFDPKTGQPVYWKSGYWVPDPWKGVNGRRFLTPEEFERYKPPAWEELPPWTREAMMKDDPNAKVRYEYWDAITNPNGTVNWEKFIGKPFDGDWRTMADAIEGSTGVTGLNVTFMLHPERIEGFVKGVNDEMDMGDLITQFEDPWAEAMFNMVADPLNYVAFIFPESLGMGAKALNLAADLIQFPAAGALKPIGWVSKRALDLFQFASIGTGTSATRQALDRAVRGKFGAASWLFNASKRSALRTYSQHVSDALTRLAMKYDGTMGVSVNEYFQRMLLGDTRILSAELLGPGALRQLRDVSQLFLDRLGTLEIGEILEKYGAWSDITETVGKREVVKKVLEGAGDPSVVGHYLTQAAESMYARELGIHPLTRGSLARALEWTGRAIRENVLGMNPRYLINNWLDNTAKTMMAGYAPPLEFNAASSISEMVRSNFGVSIPNNTLQSVVMDALDVDSFEGLAMHDLPWPIGSLKGTAMTMEKISGRRLPENIYKWMAESSVGRLSNHMSYSGVLSAGFEISSKIERTARANIWWQAFQKYVKVDGYKSLGQFVRETLPNAPASLLDNIESGAIKSVEDIDRYARMHIPQVSGDPIPETVLSDLRPKDMPQSEFSAGVTEALDKVQQDFAGRWNTQEFRMAVNDVFDQYHQKAAAVINDYGAQALDMTATADEVVARATGNADVVLNSPQASESLGWTASLDEIAMQMAHGPSGEPGYQMFANFDPDLFKSDILENVAFGMPPSNVVYATLTDFGNARLGIPPVQSLGNDYKLWAKTVFEMGLTDEEIYDAAIEIYNQQYRTMYGLDPIVRSASIEGVPFSQETDMLDWYEGRNEVLDSTVGELPDDMFIREGHDLDEFLSPGKNNMNLGGEGELEGFTDVNDFGYEDASYIKMDLEGEWEFESGSVSNFATRDLLDNMDMSGVNAIPEKAYDALTPGGRFIIREYNIDEMDVARWTETGETFLDTFRENMGSVGMKEIGWKVRPEEDGYIVSGVWEKPQRPNIEPEWEEPWSKPLGKKKALEAFSLMREDPTRKITLAGWNGKSVELDVPDLGEDGALVWNQSALMDFNKQAADQARLAMVYDVRTGRWAVADEHVNAIIDEKWGLYPELPKKVEEVGGYLREVWMPGDSTELLEFLVWPKQRPALVGEFMVKHAADLGYDIEKPAILMMSNKVFDFPMDGAKALIAQGVDPETVLYKADTFGNAQAVIGRLGDIANADVPVTHTPNTVMMVVDGREVPTRMDHIYEAIRSYPDDINFKWAWHPEKKISVWGDVKDIHPKAQMLENAPLDEWTMFTKSEDGISIYSESVEGFDGAVEYLKEIGVSNDKYIYDEVRDLSYTLGETGQKVAPTQETELGYTIKITDRDADVDEFPDGVIDELNLKDALETHYARSSSFEDWHGEGDVPEILKGQYTTNGEFEWWYNYHQGSLNNEAYITASGKNELELWFTYPEDVRLEKGMRPAGEVANEIREKLISQGASPDLKIFDEEHKLLSGGVQDEIQPPSLGNERFKIQEPSKGMRPVWRKMFSESVLGRDLAGHKVLGMGAIMVYEPASGRFVFTTKSPSHGVLKKFLGIDVVGSPTVDLVAVNGPMLAGITPSYEDAKNAFQNVYDNILGVWQKEADELPITLNNLNFAEDPSWPSEGMNWKGTLGEFLGHGGKPQFTTIQETVMGSGAKIDLRQQMFETVRNDGEAFMRGLEQWRQSAFDSIDRPGGIPPQYPNIGMQQEWDNGIGSVKAKWNEILEKNMYKASGEVNRILFDYSMKSNLEELLRYYGPFTTWQLRNPLIWAQLLAQHPNLITYYFRYMDMLERQRKAQNLPTRFQGTLGTQVPEGNPLGLPEGYYATDVRPLFSILSQFKPPFEPPTGSDAGAPNGMLQGLQSMVQGLGGLGIQPWPWISAPLEAGGVVSPGSTQLSFGPQQRALEMVLQNYGILRPGESLTLDNPKTKWLLDYYTNRRLAEMEAEGLITHGQFLGALRNPESQEWQMAQQQVMEIQNIAGAWSLVSPFNMKYTSPGEQQIYDDKAKVKTLSPELQRWFKDEHPYLESYSLLFGEEVDLAVSQVYFKYDDQMKDLLPWTEEYRTLAAQRAMELDALLGPQASSQELLKTYIENPVRVGEMDQYGLPYDEESAQRTVLYRLRDIEPRVSEFMGVPGENGEPGEIDWDGYNKAFNEFYNELESISATLGWKFTLPEYLSFRYRNASPEKVAYDLYKEYRTDFWNNYNTEKAKLSPGSEGFADLVYWAADQQFMKDIEAGFTNIEATSRMAANIRRWKTDGLPFEYESQLQASWPETVNLNKFATGVANILGIDITSNSEEYWDLKRQLDYELPGPGGQPTAADLARNQLYDWYYTKLMPDEQRKVRQFFGFEEGFVIDSDEQALTILRGLNRQGAIEMELNRSDELLDRTLAFYDNSVGLPSLSSEITPEEQAELNTLRVDMYRYVKAQEAGVGGMWTELMTKYYSDPDSPKSKFWGMLTGISLKSIAFDDPIIGPIMNRFARSFYDFTDEQYVAAYTYLKDNFSVFVDEAATQLIADHPDWYERAQWERDQFDRFKREDMELLKSQYYAIYWKERPRWERDNPEKFAELTSYMDRERARALRYPYYSYFFKKYDYSQWYGMTDPSTIDISKAAPKISDDYTKALQDMDNYLEGRGKWTQSMIDFFGPPPYRDPMEDVLNNK